MEKTMKQLTCLLVALFSGFTSSLVWAGCADLSDATKWSKVDTHKIIMYRGSTAIALLDIPYCYFYSSSDIKLVKNNICKWDKIIVDGEVCEIRSVERLDAGSIDSDENSKSRPAYSPDRSQERYDSRQRKKNSAWEKWNECIQEARDSLTKTELSCGSEPNRD